MTLMGRNLAQTERKAVSLLSSCSSEDVAEGLLVAREILVQGAAVPKLRRALTALAVSFGPNRASAVYLLGVLCDRNLKPVFDSVLKACVEQKDATTVYQALIALDNLDVLGAAAKGVRSFCLLQRSKNLRLARKYLEANAGPSFGTSKPCES